MSIARYLTSSVGRKLLNGLSAFGVVIFIIMHLLGNLSLLDKTGHAFNLYVYKLQSLGFLLVLSEVGLVLVFVLHIVSAILLTSQNRKARPVGYAKVKNAGDGSYKSVSSRTMAISGIILLVFLIWHIISFRFGPTISNGYVTLINGEPARDLFRLVSETFSHWYVVVLYVAVMIFLGFHVRHGFWSMFQTLGLNHPRYSRIIYGVALLFAIVLSLGFIILPIWMYLTGGQS